MLAWAALASSAPVLALACGSGAGLPSGKMAGAASASASVAPVVVGSDSSASSSSSSSPAPPPLLAATAVAPVATGDATPGLHWLKSLAPRAVTAKVDELVWATVPTEAGVRLGVYRVLSVNGTTASLLDVVRVRYDAVPGALIQPVALDAPLKLKLDDVVTYADWRGFVGIGLVVRVTPTLRIAFRDASSVVREETANVAVPRPAGVEPLAWVTFPKRADSPALYKGIVFAVQGNDVFVRDDALQVVVLDKAKVEPLAVPTRRLKKGDAVLAYSSSAGFEPGVVDKELVARLAYAVTVDGQPRTYFFSDLAVSPTISR